MLKIPTYTKCIVKQSQLYNTYLLTERHLVAHLFQSWQYFISYEWICNACA